MDLPSFLLDRRAARVPIEGHRETGYRRRCASPMEGSEYSLPPNLIVARRKVDRPDRVIVRFADFVTICHTLRQLVNVKGD
jgi:hypothetical protein